MGAYDDYGNGFVSQEGIPVGIYRESDQTLLVSTNVTSADSLSGFFRYTSITPLTLQSGEQYRVVAVSLNDNYNIAEYTYSFDPLVTYNGYGYTETTTLAFSNYLTGTERTWMANLQFNPTNSVPEPATMFLLGLGLIGLAGVRKKFKK